jgi:ADP-heptose:LPS heptosyltransferase
VDTSVVHLTAALGKPVWALIAASSDWRWLEEREDTPWYPSVRLFRQTDEEAKKWSWAPLLARVQSELQKLLD